MRVAVVGTGLVGGSIGLALAGLGHEIVGFDRDADHLAAAVKREAVMLPAPDLAGVFRDVDVAFVAVPVAAIADVVVEALDAGVGLVTDVGSVKAPIVAEIARRRPDDAARFIGGHPMAGSEQDGIDAARDDLFVGAKWVLTPTPATSDVAYTRLRSLLVDMHADVLSVTPADHDVLVAFVSHVPQLAASTLMDVATAQAAEHRALLGLAAGGFRDMTRIAASHPAIWVDILETNRDSVLAALDAYLAALGEARQIVAGGERDALEARLTRARAARRSLPVGAPVPSDLVEVRVPVRDRVGVLAEVTTLATRLAVNIYDIEIAHSVDAPGGVLVLVVAAAAANGFEASLHELGYLTSRSELS
jgi:prephenate dehydrogenase